MSIVLNLDKLSRFCLENSLVNFDPRHYKESTRAEIIRNIPFPDDPIVIGIFGSAFERGNVPESDYRRARDAARYIAQEISKYGGRIILGTGFCPDYSIPTDVALEVKRLLPTIPIIGISPWRDLAEAIAQAYSSGRKMDITSKVHDMVIYTDFGSFRMRDGSNCHFVDGAVAMRGATGTNDEIAGIYETGKVLSRLTGFGGSTDAQEEVIASFVEDGKHQYVEISSADPGEAVRKLVGQIYVDHSIRNQRESTSIDVYIHNSSKRGREPILNIRRFRLRGDDKHWRDAKDRRYPFITYGRQDLRHIGQLLAGIDKETAVQYVNDLLQQDIFEAPKYRQGEAGIILFPKRDIQRDVPVALELIAHDEYNNIFYQKMKEKMVA